MSAQRLSTSAGVNPKASSMSVLTMLFTFRLFSPENMPPVAICIMPVTTPSLSDLLPFNADVRNPLMKSRISRRHGLPYDSFPANRIRR